MMNKELQEPSDTKQAALRKMKEANSLYVDDLRNNCVGRYYLYKANDLSHTELVKITDAKIVINEAALFPDYDTDRIEISVISVPDSESVTEKNADAVVLYEEKTITVGCQFGCDINHYGFYPIEQESALIYINAYTEHLRYLIRSAMSRHLD